MKIKIQKTIQTFGHLFFSICTLIFLLPTYADTYSPGWKANGVTNDLRFDQVYYIQPHNTYDYGSSLKSWLEKGYRSVELDVIDKGDWEDNDEGPSVSHGMYAGNKNCSAADDDRLGHCFTDILNWLDENPNSEPLAIVVDMKASWDPASAWKSDELVLLDDFIKGYLGDKLYTYGDLIQHLDTGFSSDYRTTLKNMGWPTVEELRGKIIVILTGGHYSDANNRMGKALESRDKYDQATFFCPYIGTADPDGFSEKIDSISSSNSKNFFCGNVELGDHYQVTANRANEYKQLMHVWGGAGDFNNTDYAATYIGVAHGTSVLSWDLDEPNDTPWWASEYIPLVGERRSLPGYFMMKSVFNGMCIDVHAYNYSNGGTISQWTCNGQQNQQFVYTAEGQLRPRQANQYCIDVDGGKADKWEKTHLWDCDGGDSEKWRIRLEGDFKNLSNGGGYCIDIPAYSTTIGTQLQTYPCNNASNQKWILEAVSDWEQSDF
ncbi:Ca2+-dependent phosphoinositide-specific phospholipase C [Pleionea sediminis]|uniref:Ca2+-dependent phosphoinositide-specific phospholipase C n=1 Tax=Pleionea sediminis TaxID=2569479 RepID=UPI001186C81C|nr:Ca2+-dependent phosphoinositide-specific phospholipase C [Pleionea sediminis]